MADDFGLKIGIEGEKEFKNALWDINQSFKVLGSEMTLVTSQFDKQDKSVAALTARNQMLHKEIDAQKEKVTTLEAALKNASESFGENDKRTQAWQIQLNNAKAALNGMEKELDSNNAALDAAAKELDDAEKQADQFGDEIKDTAKETESAGGKFEKLGAIVKGVGAAVAAGVAVIGAAAVSAGKALVEMTVSAAAYADEMLTQSTVTGMPVESLQAYSYAADLVDVSLDTLTSSMAKQVKSMSNAQQGSAKYVAAYDALGVAVTNADGSLRDSEEVYWETIDALGSVANETERDALAMQIFGKSAQDLNPLIAQGSAGIAALTEEAKQMGAVLSEDSIAKLGAFDDSIQRLKQGSEAAKNVMGTVLLPQLQTLADDGVSLLGQFTSGLASAGGDFDKISEVIGQTVGGIADMILGSLPQIVGVGLQIVMSIGSAISANLPLLVDCASTIVMTLLSGLASSLSSVSSAALQLLLCVSDAILSNLPLIAESAILVVSELASGIGSALPDLVPSIVDTVIMICSTLLDNLDKILAAAASIVSGLASGILRALPKLVAALPKIITQICDFVSRNLPQIIELGIQLTVQLAVGLIRAIPQLVACLPQIISAILSGLGSAVSSVVEIGKNIVSGLWRGIQAMASWITSKVKSFFSGIVSSAKRVLGISSPSKVFAGIGENMGQGVGVGFVDAMSDVEKEINDAIPQSVDVDPIRVLSGLTETVNLNPGTETLSAKVDTLLGVVREYLPQLATMQMVTDTGATIGWLAPGMDDALGQMRKRKERYV